MLLLSNYQEGIGLISTDDIHDLHGKMDLAWHHYFSIRPQVVQNHCCSLDYGIPLYVAGWVLQSFF